jgi:hypothetical protein
MSGFWMPGRDVAIGYQLQPSGRSSGVIHCEILNGMEVSKAGFQYAGEGTVPFPVAQLKLTLEDFDADYFSWNGRYFVSERMRQAMALDASAVHFFDVDASWSAPLPRSKNYQLMEPAVIEDVSDPEKSVYEMSRAMPYLPLSPTSVRHIAFRPDAAPKHDLFFDRFFGGRLFCTDAFALRVLSAGCTGMTFGDPNNPHKGGRFFFRTLRGIEEYIRWDRVNKVGIMELVQPSH